MGGFLRKREERREMRKGRRSIFFSCSKRESRVRATECFFSSSFDESLFLAHFLCVEFPPSSFQTPCLSLPNPRATRRFEPILIDLPLS